MVLEDDIVDIHGLREEKHVQSVNESISSNEKTDNLD